MQLTEKWLFLSSNEMCGRLSTRFWMGWTEVSIDEWQEQLEITQASANSEVGSACFSPCSGPSTQSPPPRRSRSLSVSHSLTLTPTTSLFHSHSLPQSLRSHLFPPSLLFYIHLAGMSSGRFLAEKKKIWKRQRDTNTPGRKVCGLMIFMHDNNKTCGTWSPIRHQLIISKDNEPPCRGKAGFFFLEAPASRLPLCCPTPTLTNTLSIIIPSRCRNNSHRFFFFFM